MSVPSRDILELPPPAADARISYGPEALQFGDLRLPSGPGPHPVVIVVHGGFWRAFYNLEYFGHVCAALTARGLATWNIEYRRIGNPGGAWSGTFLDVAAAADHLRVLAQDYPLDLDRVIALGHSAGGHLALWLAGRSRLPGESPLIQSIPLPLRAAISLCGVADLHRAWELRLGDGVVRDLLGGTPEEYPERYAAASPAALLPLGVRQLLIHGEQDQAVPFHTIVEYVAAAGARGDDVTLLALPDTGHFEVVDPRSAQWPQVDAAIHAEMPGAGTAPA